ncbi:MAG: hypothetical protein R3242_01240 [Akkermansiaceae bacterium]|nr:hypothetical protein [Akkermansiaceae bacterium]
MSTKFATLPSLLLASCLALAGPLHAEEFKQVDFGNNTIHIPIYEGEIQPPIRGVMQNVRGPLKTFAYENNVALIAKLDDGRGFTKRLLKDAAEASGRPEIEHAGAIVQGISKGGRAAADWADANRERAIAVILDHSAIWRMDFPKRVSGVPMFFNATYADMYQNIDRRKSHFDWCTAAFRAGQPCTSIIDHVKNGGHGGRGSTDLTAIWLGEAMNLRVPANIPTGKAYQLIDVDPSKVGGYVTAKISMDGKRSYHDDVEVTTQSSGANWWVPGPKSAALYLEWVKKNGGEIKKDESAQIVNKPVFLDLPPALARAADLVGREKWGQAYTELQKSPSKEDHFAKTLMLKINNKVDSHIALIRKQQAMGDLCAVYINFQNHADTYRGIPAYDELLTEFGTFFKDPANAKQLEVGREFYRIMGIIAKAGSANADALAALKKFATTHEGAPYGKAAQTAHAKLSDNPRAKLTPDMCFGD